jgi:hypothetical protein
VYRSNDGRQHQDDGVKGRLCQARTGIWILCIWCAEKKVISGNGDADCILFYHASGGSTIVCLFEKNVVEWDEDLLINGRASLETLVRVGMGIGRRRGSAAVPVNVVATGAVSGSA